MITGFIPMEPLVAFADSTLPFQFITNVSITDQDGNEFSGEVAKDSKLRLQYDFAIPDTTTGSAITVGLNYEFIIPQEIPIKSPLNISLKDSNEVIFGNVVIGTDNKGTITFTEEAASLSGVTGYFWVYSEFDKEKIGNDGQQNIEFDLGKGQTEVIPINFPKEDETSNINLIKSGSYNQEQNEITWTVKIKPETTPNTRELRDVVIKDIIEASQTYIDGSATITPNGVGSFKYDDANKELSFAFSEPINKVANEEYTITFKTRPEVSGFTANNQTISFKNKASADYKDRDTTTTVLSNEAKVDITSNFIEKEGLAGFDYIDWTVKINNNYFAITDAKITDKLPEGLTLEEGSIKLNGTDMAIDNTNGPLKYDSGTRTLTYEFGAGTTINIPQTLTYRTKVTDPEAFTSNTPKTYTNEAGLTGIGVPADTKVGVGVSVATSVIEKSGQGYNPSNQEITWRIIVNNNKIDMKGAVVTDSIPAGLEYVSDSFTVKDNDENNVTPIDGLTFDVPPAGANQRGLLKYNIPDNLTGNKTVTIEFKTKVLDNNLYATNKTTNFTNEAVLNYTGGPESKSPATQQVKSEVISKRSLGYNYNTREIEWEVKINQNKMPLTNVVVTDIIPMGHKYVVDSSIIGTDPIDPSYNVNSNTLIYSVGDITDEKIIKFKTKVDDITIFEDNNTIKVTNTAKITANQIPGEVQVTADRNINNTVVGKKGTYQSGNNFIKWEVTVNQNSLKIDNPVLEDILQEGLSLDTDSVKLFETVLANDGNLTKGDEVTPLTGDNIKYNGATRKFEFHFNKTIDGPYILEFTTDIDDAYRNSTFTNTIYFKGSRPEQQSTSSNIAVSFQIGGGGASGTLGSITLDKVDSSNNDIKLQGATFQIIDSFGNILSEKTTNSEGRIVFDKLKFRTYTIKEVSAPEGYILNQAPLSVTINSSNKDITRKIENSGINGTIQLRKIDAQTKEPIEGAKFELFKTNETPTGITSLSGSDGLVVFENIPYGSYIIKEIAPANYYKNQNLELKATISQDNSVIFAGPSENQESLYNFENVINTGNLRITKIDKDNNQVKLKDAVFRLFRIVGEEEILVSEKTTDTNGMATWEDLRYGNYVAREISAPQGYYLNTQKLEFELSDETIQNSNTLDLTFENEKIPLGTLVINKIDSYSAEPLANVEFEIYKVSDLETLIKKVKTDINGKAEIQNLEIGDYVIREVNTPAGYHILKVDQAITIEDGKSASIVIKNDPLRSLVVKKVDRSNPTILLPGAVFTLKNENGVQIGSNVTTGQDGKAVFNLLEFGKYTLKEITAPSGYLLNDTEIEIVLDKDTELIKTIEITNQRRPSGGGGGGGTTPVTPTTPPVVPPTTPPVVPPVTPPVVPPVTPNPTPPVTTPENTPIGGQVDIPDEGVPTVVVPPQNGEVTIDEDGNWVYTPNPGFVGEDSFTIVISSPDGDEEVVIDIEVEEIPLGVVTPPSEEDINGDLPTGVPVLPKTGAIDSTFYYLLGAILIFIGFKIRRR